MLNGTFNAQQGTSQFTDTDFFTIVSSGEESSPRFARLPHKPERQHRRPGPRNLPEEE
jgi:hypothetical protein